jgi:hypothetical protein
MHFPTVLCLENQVLIIKRIFVDLLCTMAVVAFGSLPLLACLDIRTVYTSRKGMARVAC